MRYPNDFLKLRSSASPIGQSDKRALDGIAAPYLQKVSPGSVTTKKNGFTENVLTGGEPILYGFYLNATGSLQAVTIDPDGKTTEVKNYQNVESTGAYAPKPFLNFMRPVFVGDGYALTLYTDLSNVAFPDAAFWSVLERIKSLGDQTEPGDADNTRKSTSFIAYRLHGQPTARAYYFSVIGSGWGNADTRYRFCITATRMPSPGANGIPVCFVGDTGSQTMRQVSIPYFPAQQYFGFQTYSLGPGALISLNKGVTHDPLDPPTYETGRTRTIPYFNLSADHGESWTSAFASDLIPYLKTTTYLGDSYYSALQQLIMTQRNVITYTGNGSAIMVIPNGYVDALGDPLEDDGARYCPMAFAVAASGGLTRLPWPADTWYCNDEGLSTIDGSTDRVLFEAPGTLLDGSLASGSYIAPLAQQLGFGDGCMFVPVLKDGARKIMFTHDSGASWEFSAALPDEIALPLEGLDSFTGVVLSPFASESKAGRILFSARNADDTFVNIWQTNGLFQRFTKAYGFKPKGGLYPGLGGRVATERYFTYFGGDIKPMIFPAFPQEFKKS